MKVSNEVKPSLWEYFPDYVVPAGCPSRVVLDHVTSKWGVLVLVALSAQTLRWGELRRRAQGISEKMLAQTLRTLEEDGLVSRHPYPVIPPRVDYSLTPRGRELAGLLIPLVEWSVANAEEILRRKDRLPPLPDPDGEVDESPGDVVEREPARRRARSR